MDSVVAIARQRMLPRGALDASLNGIAKEIAN